MIKIEESKEEFHPLVQRKKFRTSDAAVAVFEKLKQREESDEEFSDEELYEEEIEKPKDDEDFKEEYIGELPDEIERVPRDRAIISSEMLEEHSRQLKGQVIVYVKKQIQSILDDMKQMESELITVRKKIDGLDQCLQDVSEKISFKDHSFTKKADELRALRNMTENHQLSLVHVTRQLEQNMQCECWALENVSQC
ncbi:uncharacterized protein LOC129233628 [Uloborus diversus]|uniref:uncharacterized protein LOC129233628 n=1 Tax=Uloborus diversus TaxID=327109 RepID=UPI00240988E7|nr:uncharacterized protein LOC129233628 [Uloborus diversus]